MKLSDAIRIGATKLPHSRQKESFCEINGEMSSNFFGAMIHGFTGEIITDFDYRTKIYSRYFAKIFDRIIPSPPAIANVKVQIQGHTYVVGDNPMSVAAICIAMEDDLGWTREAIADQLDIMISATDQELGEFDLPEVGLFSKKAQAFNESLEANRDFDKFTR